MKNKYDINQFVNTITIASVSNGIVERVKEKRKKMKLSQQKLAIRSGVSYASIRRFETTGEISFSSLLKIANALECLADFNLLFPREKITNLKDLWL